MPALAVGVLDVVVDEAEVVAELDRRGTGQRLAVVAGERLVGEHAEQRAHPLAARAAGAVDAEVVGEHLVQRPRVAAALVEDADISASMSARISLNSVLMSTAEGYPTSSISRVMAPGRGAGSDRIGIMIRRCSRFRSAGR